MVRHGAGERARRFLGALNRSGLWVAYAPLARPSRLVEPAETVTITYDDDWYGPGEDGSVGDGTPDFTVRLCATGGDATHEMRLVESE